MSPALEVLATYQGGASALVAPRDIAIPFAWVHDHRRGASAPQWRGEGSALVLEAWQDASGVRLVDLGVEIGTLRRLAAGQLELQLSDEARASVEFVGADGRTQRADLGDLPAGTQVLTLPWLAGASRVKLEAVSLYDSKRRAEKLLVLEDTSPRRVALRQNVPNPFNPTTTISFAMPGAGRAVVEVFDVKGRRVRQLFAGDLDAGTHAFVWDGRDAVARAMPSGVYFYRLQAPAEPQERKMLLAQ